ncbi:hypothetical protein UZ36_06530, partial [Candidatus Nitromaritima sp. SCGC AAA799-C22]
DEMIREAFRLNKEVFVPLVDEKEGRLQVAWIPGMEIEFVRGKYGIREPAPEVRRMVSPSRIDLVVAPGLAFDPRGGRIGYGGGYFDRLLKEIPENATRIGVGFDFQILDSVPQTNFDVPVQMVITESKTLVCRDS